MYPLRMLSVEVHKREFTHLGSLHRRFIPCSLKHIRWKACMVKKDKINRILSSVCVTVKTFWKRTCCENFRWLWRTTYEAKKISLRTQQKYCFRLHINAKKITLVRKQTTITMEVNIITIVILEACIQRKPYNGNIRALDAYIAHEFINRQVQRLEMTQIPTQNITPLSTQFKLSILGHKFKIGHANFKTENGSNENKMIQYG